MPARWRRRQTSSDEARAEATPQPAGGGADDQSQAPAESAREPAGDGASEESAAPAADAGLSDLADKVETLLGAAHAAAAAIRREAELDAERILKDQRRSGHVVQEIHRLSRLAETISVQAEAVRRQCAVLAELVPLGDGLTAPGGEVDHSRCESHEPAGPPPASGDVAQSAWPRLGESESESRRRRAPRRPGWLVSRERTEAYRMKLAGASRSEVEDYLERAGVRDWREIAAEVFQPSERARLIE